MINNIQDDVKAAMRSKDTLRLGTLRMLTAAIKQREVDSRTTLDDAQILSIIEKLIKQRKESIVQYQAGNRTDLAEREAAEINILQHYLPAQLSEQEIAGLIDASIKEVGATSIKDLGKVIANIKAKAQGRADMGQISAQVKSILENK